MSRTWYHPNLEVGNEQEFYSGLKNFPLGQSYSLPRRAGALPYLVIALPCTILFIGTKCTTDIPSVDFIRFSCSFSDFLSPGTTYWKHQSVFSAWQFQSISGNGSLPVSFLLRVTIKPTPTSSFWSTAVAWWEIWCSSGLECSIFMTTKY